MSARKAATPLCDQFGLDAGWREAQLSLIGLNDHSREHTRLLHDRVLTAEVITWIVDRFYEQLLRHQQAAQILSSFDVDHLKHKQVAYFREFGVRFGEAGYFESRARVGVAHARVGVPLSLYLESFGMMQCLILEALMKQVQDAGERELLTRLVLRLTTLDIALATEVYHRARLEDMDRSLKHLQLEQKLLRRQVERDALTGVSSRTSLLHELRGAIARAAKTGQPLSLVMVDLDHFKEVNDRHGHLVGDKVLREVASRIKAALREFDMVGRYGGEEFVVLLEDTSPHTALQIAERIRTRIASEPIHVAGLDLDLTISQGLARYQDGDDSRSLLERADAAMYRAKQAGRNCVVEA
ncbi:MAG TPA: diguanylate cyclase [Gammaproteobacteria bacterium]|nr:diguanylate cyclase [Gammaproteobacteria bacterium]